MVSACTLTTPLSDPTRFYVLNARKASTQAAFENPIKVALLRVEIPAYLRGRSLVVRQAENEVHYSNAARWAEALDLGLMRVIREDLSDRPEISQILTPPLPTDDQRDFDLVVRVVNCEGVVRDRGQASVLFKAIAEIYSPGIGGKLLAKVEFAAPPATWDGRDYGALVEKVNGAVGQFCAQIPTALAEAKGKSAQGK